MIKALPLLFLIAGCQTTSQYLRSAEEIQAENDRYWEEVETRKQRIITLPSNPVETEVEVVPLEQEDLPLGP